jgi:retinol dehydrogenase 12
MSAKVAIVTGANAGIGRATAAELAAQGWQVVMVCRSAERGGAAQREIIAQTGNPKVDLLLADLSSKVEIERLAAEILAAYPRLDVLINNAGAIFNTRQESADGLEMTFALNHMGYFWLTNHLRQRLIESAPARIINLSSDAHQGGKLFWDDLQLTHGYSAFKAYSQSKLANVLFTKELARQLAGTGVTVNAAHPGFVDSQFGKNSGGLFRWMLKLMRPFMRSSEQGAATTLALATSPQWAAVTGEYFADSQLKTPAKLAQDPAAAQRLWQVSTQF